MPILPRFFLAAFLQMFKQCHDILLDRQEFVLDRLKRLAHFRFLVLSPSRSSSSITRAAVLGEAVPGGNSGRCRAESTGNAATPSDGLRPTAFNRASANRPASVPFSPLSSNGLSSTMTIWKSSRYGARICRAGSGKSYSLDSVRARFHVPLCSNTTVRMLGRGSLPGVSSSWRLM
jgi:hypothetical protein